MMAVIMEKQLPHHSTGMVACGVDFICENAFDAGRYVLVLKDYASEVRRSCTGYYNGYFPRRITLSIKDH